MLSATGNRKPINNLNSKDTLGFPGGSESKESACNAGDLGLIPGSERSPGEGMATDSSILPWEISWTEGSLAGYSPWYQQELDTT